MPRPFWSGRFVTLVFLFTTITLPQLGFSQGKKATSTPSNSGRSTPSPGGHKVTGAGSDGQARKVSKDTSKLDFDDANIDGQVKNPFASFLSSRDGETPDGFIKIRKNWHDKMAQSVSGLSQ